MLAGLRATVAGARPMPMSASCLVNRVETLEVIDAIIAALPQTLTAADDLLAREQAVLTAAQEQADALLAEAEGELERRFATTQEGATVAAWAKEHRAQAQAEAKTVQADAEAEADSTLAHLEVVLGRALAGAREADLHGQADEIEQLLDGVRRGRERMAGRHHMEDLGDHLRFVDESGDDPGAGLGTREELG